MSERKDGGETGRIWQFLMSFCPLSTTSHSAMLKALTQQREAEIIHQRAAQMAAQMAIHREREAYRSRTHDVLENALAESFYEGFDMAASMSFHAHEILPRKEMAWEKSKARAGLIKGRTENG